MSGVSVLVDSIVDRVSLPPQGASLGTMVGWMTYGWKKFESVDSIMRRSIGPLYQAMQELLPLVDADSAAFELFQVLSLSTHYCATSAMVG